MFLVLKHRKRFEALRNFTLESGREEIERRNRHRKEATLAADLDGGSIRDSVDSLRSPTSASHPQTAGSSDVPEDKTFAIGDDDDDSESESRPTPAPSTPSENPSRSSSVASRVDDALPTQLRGMSEKARGKMPAGTQSFSRQNSTTSLSGRSTSAAQSTPGSGGTFEPTAEWIESWLPELPLHTVLSLIQQLSVLIPRQKLAADTPSRETIRQIQDVRLVGVEPSPVRVHSFEWSPLALGWYESLIWSFVFSSEMLVSKGTVGIWNGTAIKLFKVQETAPEGPSLTSPRGAVDAVGSNIVSRIGAINLRGATGGASAPAPAAAGGGGAGGATAPSAPSAASAARRNTSGTAARPS